MIDALKFLEDLTAESASEPVPQHGDWRDTLTAAERALFPAGWEPPPDWLALVLKADFARLDSEHAFFHEIRATLGTAPVTVPVSIEAHKALALKYLVG